MKNRDFNDPGQAQNYLNGCIITVGNEPVFIHSVRGEGRNLALDYGALDSPNARVSRVMAKDKTVDMNPVKLGMCCYFDSSTYRTFYVARYPARVWRVGLSRDNISISHILGKGEAGDWFDKIFTSPSLANCIRGKYDKLPKIMEAFENYRGVIPFSRRFAVSHNGLLIYKTLPEKVGSFSLSTGKAKLDENYQYLEEALQEDVQ